MKTLILAIGFSIIASVLMISEVSVAYADDDPISCVAEVRYGGKSYHVKESVKSADYAQKEVIEEACDKACDNLPDKDEDACEKKCESSAELYTLDCVEMASKAVVKRLHPKQYCTAEVVYNNQIYTVSDDIDSHEDAAKELLDEACDKACDHLSGSDEDACEMTCKSSAKINKMRC